MFRKNCFDIYSDDIIARCVCFLQRKYSQAVFPDVMMKTAMLLSSQVSLFPVRISLKIVVNAFCNCFTVKLQFFSLYAWFWERIRVV